MPVLTNELATFLIVQAVDSDAGANRRINKLKIAIQLRILTFLKVEFLPFIIYADCWKWTLGYEVSAMNLHPLKTLYNR